MNMDFNSVKSLVEKLDNMSSIDCTNTVLSLLVNASDTIKNFMRFYIYWTELYGTGLQVNGWYLNGESEPFDSFYDSAVEYMNRTDTTSICSESAKEVWFEFGDVPMNPETECIEESWRSFPAGTHREDIWHWFESTFNVSVHDLMYGE